MLTGRTTDRHWKAQATGRRGTLANLVEGLRHTGRILRLDSGLFIECSLTDALGLVSRHARFRISWLQAAHIEGTGT